MFIVQEKFKGWDADNDRFQARLASRISASMKFGVGAGDDAVVKGWITDSVIGPEGHRLNRLEVDGGPSCRFYSSA